MAEDEYSLPNRIKKAQARIERQREIVGELNRYGCGESAQKLLDLMEQTLGSLQRQERQQNATSEPAEELNELADELSEPAEELSDPAEELSEPAQELREPTEPEPALAETSASGNSPV